MRVGLAVSALALVAGAGGCSGSNGGGDAGTGDGDGSSTTIRTTDPDLAVRASTYVVPDGALDGAEAGDVIAATEQPPGTEWFADARRITFLYASEDRDGEPNVVSGQVLVPEGEAPDGGWPVVSWAHGTTGVADVCAPSLTDNLFYDEYAQEAASLLDAGYAVAATDYEGLGTPEMHGYLDGISEGNAVVDVVRAARNVVPELSTTWFAEGHSQGGQAVLFATRAAARAPELDLRGTVAIAPASGLEAALPAIVAGQVPADLVYGTYVLAGLTTVHPEIELTEELGPAGIEHLDVLVEDGCLLDALPKLDVDEVDQIFAFDMAGGAELSKLVAEYGNPETEPVVGPVLVQQGADDHDIPAGLTQQMVRRFAEVGSPVEYREYPGRNHDTVLGPSICDRLTWLAEHGGPTVVDCEPYETDLS
jgi:pimeloyl-ACP methyl ester carboxylesterase